ncbi:MAG: hypothetical protein J5518_04010 [Lachnospiraceae bacterium]|nr:hypothetical protein [Lachnospiraceae bacterium]
MSRREKIEIDFARSLERAQELEDMAARLYELAKNGIPGTLQMIAEGFGGENGTRFREKSAKMEPALLTLADRMMIAARNIRFSAEVIYRAEKSAEMIF